MLATNQTECNISAYASWDSDSKKQMNGRKDDIIRTFIHLKGNIIILLQLPINLLSKFLNDKLFFHRFTAETSCEPFFFFYSCK